MENRDQNLRARITKTQRGQLEKIMELQAQQGNKTTMSDVMVESLDTFIENRVKDNTKELHQWELSKELIPVKVIRTSKKYTAKDVYELIENELFDIQKKYHEDNKSKLVIAQMLSDVARQIAEDKDKREKALEEQNRLYKELAEREEILKKHVQDYEYVKQRILEQELIRTGKAEVLNEEEFKKELEKYNEQIRGELRGE